jgi:phosphohistidine phosphatase
MAQPQVILVRHAHAEWPSWSGRDFDRPLTPRGEEDAARTAHELRQAGHRPALLLASPALRTRQTAGIIAGILELAEGTLKFDDGFYNSTPATLAAALRHVTRNTDGCVMLVAHNPAISELARQLAGDRSAPGFAPADWRVLPLPAGG